MLKLSRSLSIFSWWSPFIIPCYILPSPHVNHWFNCENMSRFHETNSFIASIMGNFRCLMKHCTCSVSLICLDYLISKRFAMISNNITNLFVHSPWFAIGDRFHQAIICCFNQSSRTFRSFSNTICFIHICMKSLMIATYININQIPFYKRSCIWDTVTNYFINWCATTSWKFEGQRYFRLFTAIRVWCGIA